VFVCEGEGVRREISSMPGQSQLSVDQVVEVAREAERLGIGGLILFGLPGEKDAEGTGAWKDDGIVQTALRAIR
jgi:porphobilinogen synthase